MAQLTKTTIPNQKRKNEMKIVNIHKDHITSFESQNNIQKQLQPMVMAFNMDESKELTQAFESQKERLSKVKPKI